MDGASSQSIYSQRFDDTDLSTGVENEQSLFQAAIVALKLEIGDTTVWSNSKPSSLHFCRPLYLQYRKETKGSPKAEELDVEREKSLQDFELEIPFCNQKAKKTVRL